MTLTTQRRLELIRLAVTQLRELPTLDGEQPPTEDELGELQIALSSQRYRLYVNLVGGVVESICDDLPDNISLTVVVVDWDVEAGEKDNTRVANGLDDLEAWAYTTTQFAIGGVSHVERVANAYLRKLETERAPT